jgi:hypothetical protein
VPVSAEPGWNKLTLTLTHSADRFISNDTTLAHRIQRLVGDHHHPPGMGGQASAAGPAPWSFVEQVDSQAVPGVIAVPLACRCWVLAGRGLPPGNVQDSVAGPPSGQPLGE